MHRPDARRRAAAAAAMVLAAAGVGLLVLAIGTELRRLALDAVLVLVALFGAWHALTRLGWRRIVAVVVCAASVVGVGVVTVVGERTNALLGFAGIGALAGAAVLARWALGRDVRTLKAEPTAGTPVAAARRPVLLINPRSGGGKAQRFSIARLCRERGIEPVVLSHGDDLERLARGAIERGADVVGMAGGDGSQAIVAAVAATRDVAMVVVPAGTQNHLALDLGLDRNDVVGALDAFGDAVERRIDLADVNGHPFVNNVSLGLYASIVRSPEYREAKVETALSALPALLGPGTTPFDLEFRGPDGATRRGAHVIEVSNNPYGRTPSTTTSRPRLDTHRLGILTLEIDDDRSVARLLTAVAERHPERYDGFEEWTTTSFEVGSAGTVDAGVDGETATFDPPLRFSIRPQALRVRLPLHAIGASPASRSMGARSVVGGLWRLARGEPAVAA